MTEPTASTARPKVVVTRVFTATAAHVFNAWLDSKTLGKWLFATPGGEMQRVEVDPRVGGEFVVVEQRGAVVAEHFGKYLELVPHQRIVFSFTTDREQQPTLVTVELRELASGCELTLTHEIDPKWASYLDRTRAGWTMILDNLATTLSAEG